MSCAAQLSTFIMYQSVGGVQCREHSDSSIASSFKKATYRFSKDCSAAFAQDRTIQHLDFDLVHTASAIPLWRL